MTGFAFAFGSALFAATSDLLSKGALRSNSVLLTAWVRLASAAPFLLPALLFIEIPQIGMPFLVVIALLIPLEATAIILYMKALQISPLSLTVPFLSLTPAFTLITSYLMLGEAPDISGAAGVLLIVFGTFLLNVHLTRHGIWEPFRAILRERGSLLMMAVAFIYSITTNLGKLAIHYSSPAFMGIVYMPLVSLALLPLAVRDGMKTRHLRDGGKLFCLIGVSQALMSLCHFKAISMILVPYMVSVKRLSLLFAVVFGGIFFQEGHLKERLLASLIMLAGIILMVL